MANVQATSPPQSCPTMIALPGREVVDDGEQVGDQLVGLVALDAFGLAAQVVAALVDGDDMERLARAGIWARHEYQKSGNPWIITISGSSFLPRLT